MQSRSQRKVRQYARNLAAASQKNNAGTLYVTHNNLRNEVFRPTNNNNGTWKHSRSGNKTFPTAAAAMNDLLNALKKVDIQSAHKKITSLSPMSTTPARYRATFKNFTIPENARQRNFKAPEHAQRIGGGRFGDIFTVPGNTALHIAQGLTQFKTVWGLPKPKNDVILKVLQPPTHTRLHGVALTISQWIQATVDEMFVQAKLGNSRKCSKVGDKTFCTADFVPRVYFGGFDPVHGCFIICMEKVTGENLENVTDDRRLTVPMYKKLEKAIISLMLSGIFHTDLHLQNVLIDLKSKTLKIIDFGGSVMMRDLVGKDTRRYGQLMQKFRHYVRTQWPEKALIHLRYEERLFPGMTYNNRNNVNNLLKTYVNGMTKEYMSILTDARGGIPEANSRAAKLL